MRIIGCLFFLPYFFPGKLTLSALKLLKIMPRGSLFIWGNLGVDCLPPYGVFPENFPKNVILILSSLLVILLCHFCYLEVVCVFLTLIRMITNLLFNNYVPGIRQGCVLRYSCFKVNFSLGATSIISLYLYFHLGLLILVLLIFLALSELHI